MSDMNKTLSRFVSISTQNLNSTRTFVEPCTPAPRMAQNHVHTSHELINATPKLTTEEIINHNKIKEDVELRLESNQNSPNSYKQVLSDICRTYKSSFDRLNGFFAEVQKVQSNKSVDAKNEVSLTGLDQDLLHLMDKLNKVSEKCSHWNRQLISNVLSFVFRLYHKFVLLLKIRISTTQPELKHPIHYSPMILPTFWNISIEPSSNQHLRKMKKTTIKSS